MLSGPEAGAQSSMRRSGAVFYYEEVEKRRVELARVMREEGVDTGWTSEWEIETAA